MKFEERALVQQNCRNCIDVNLIELLLVIGSAGAFLLFSLWASQVADFHFQAKGFAMCIRIFRNPVN